MNGHNDLRSSQPTIKHSERIKVPVMHRLRLMKLTCTTVHIGYDMFRKLGSAAS
jgi:hypothetical protein